jgi:probable phosphoglycerate mutase
MPGVTLGSIGKAQAERLAIRLEREKPACILSSPLERALETAKPIARKTGSLLEVSGDLIEIDFGAWSGVDFETLSHDPSWSSWNNVRSVSRPPDGETMIEAQTRIVNAIERSRRNYVGRPVVLVSHSDMIKNALLYYLGLPIDAYARLEIDPASISTLVVGDWGAKILRLNEVVTA